VPGRLSHGSRRDPSRSRGLHALRPREPMPETPRPAGRQRERGAVSGQWRRILHHRTDYRRGWRLGHAL